MTHNTIDVLSDLVKFFDKIANIDDKEISVTLPEHIWHYLKNEIGSNLNDVAIHKSSLVPALTVDCFSVLLNGWTVHFIYHKEKIRI